MSSMAGHSTRTRVYTKEHLEHLARDLESFGYNYLKPGFSDLVEGGFFALVAYWGKTKNYKIAIGAGIAGAGIEALRTLGQMVASSEIDMAVKEIDERCLPLLSGAYTHIQLKEYVRTLDGYSLIYHALYVRLVVVYRIKCNNGITTINLRREIYV
ncbi:hypothetical protein PRVXT_000645 [Proteinivorax tanatarense]|uniref:Uncharacterized protein n=1 Tax=Proteinivorax tanatarense TaxID=1260629 RepID=A0AAU7VN44_9FIRM